MCHALLQTPAFFSLLRRIDEDLMQSAQGNGCCHCGQPLHRADYPRKPRGCPQAARQDCNTRLSLCCAGCRRRTTPDSVRFLGRRVYLAIITMLRSSRVHGSSMEGLADVSWVTLKRWRVWWADTFPATPAGRWLGGRLPPASQSVAYPERLLQSVQADTDTDRFTAALRLLLPPV